eukprot:COSAG06_NODE_27357_length_594_cov_3.202020_1_plen_100_part_10
MSARQDKTVLGTPDSSTLYCYSILVAGFAFTPAAATCWPALGLMMRLLGVLGCAVAAASPAPTMLNVEWSFGAPDIPHGTQCSLSGVLGDSWILALGNRA